MAPKRRRKMTPRFGILLAVFFAVVALVTVAFMLRSINGDIEDYSWKFTDPSKPLPPMPQPARTLNPQQTAIPTKTPEPIETAMPTMPSPSVSDSSGA